VSFVNVVGASGKNLNSKIQMGRRKKQFNVTTLEDTKAAANTLIAKLTEAAKKPERLASTPEEIFRLFAMFVGDVERTAIASNKSVDEIVEMSLAGNWQKRIAVLIKLQKSGIPGDTERGVNRAINFIQADRLRQLIERVVQMLMNMSEGEMVENLLSITVDKDGNSTTRVVTRPFADLATALEKCHAMTYQSLSDTATDRKDRRETEDSNGTAGEMHMALVDAFAKVRTQQPKAQLQVAFDAPDGKSPPDYRGPG